MNRYALYMLLAAFSLTACGTKEADRDATPQYAPAQPAPADINTDARAAEETAAQAVLDTVRLAFSAGGFETARNKVKSIRTRFPHALNAREDAILLLDSIEMHEAAARVAILDATGRVEMDENVAVERAKAADKVQFFSDKLAHDRAARKQH